MRKIPEHEKIARADQAKALLTNPMYIEAMDKIEIALFGAFGDTKFEDEDKRHELWQRIKVKKLFQQQFEQIVNDGEYAEDTMKMIDSVQDNKLNSEQSE